MVKVETVKLVAANGLYIRQVTKVSACDLSVTFMERLSQRRALVQAYGYFAAESALCEDAAAKHALMEAARSIDAAGLPRGK